MTGRITAYVVAAALTLGACSPTPATPPAANPAVGAAAPAAGESAGGNSAPHGDHTPHHGGVVMMKGEDLHYEVVLDPTGERVGTVNEDFAIESMGGDIFQLGNASWKILRVLPGVVRVEDARGQPPTIPFWLGEAPSRTAELSHAVSDLRVAVGDRLESSERWSKAAA